jgi:broad specificity phosphatase PhoE
MYAGLGMFLYLVRHGQTRWNVERRLQGRADSPLTLLGLEQVRAFGALLRATLPADCDAELWASPLPRARQTGSLIAELLELPSARCFESELLAERHCGAWEGLTLGEIEARSGAGAQQQYREWDTPIGGDGETLAQVQERARAFLALQRRAEHVVVVTHGIFSRQFRGAYLGLDPTATMALESHAQDRIYRLAEGAITTLHTVTT